MATPTASPGTVPRDPVSVHHFHATTLHRFGLDHHKPSHRLHRFDSHLTGVNPGKVVRGADSVNLIKRTLING